MLFRRFYLEDGRFPHKDAAPEVYVFQFRQAFGNLSVYRYGSAGGPAVIHPIPALDEGRRFCGGDPFLLVHIRIVHGRFSSPIHL